VIVTIRKLGDKTVYVGGEVGRPGLQAYRDGLTPLQAIMTAGGFLATARIDSVIFVRPVGEGPYLARKLDMGRVVNNGEREPIDLAPNDVLFVPRTKIANADLWVRQYIVDLFPFVRYVPYGAFY
jgi:protein involved in polysaccharide export with SLBB domain